MGRGRHLSLAGTPADYKAPWRTLTAPPVASNMPPRHWDKDAMRIALYADKNRPATGALGRPGMARRC